MSVWVCSKRQITLMSHPVESCCDYSKECSRDGGGCDAVEYAPKHDLDAAINERDLLQERCDELRKKIALMEKKG